MTEIKKVCTDCGWLMEAITMCTKNPMSPAPENNEYYMIIEDDEQRRAYKFWECPNPSCGLMQMYRDHSKDAKLEQPAEALKLYRKEHPKT